MDDYQVFVPTRAGWPLCATTATGKGAYPVRDVKIKEGLHFADEVVPVLLPRSSRKKDWGRFLRILGAVRLLPVTVAQVVVH